MSRFAVIPPAPTNNVPEWEFKIINAMVQNVDLLTGNRTDGTNSNKAVLRSTYDFSNAVPTPIPVTLEQYPDKPMSGYNVNRSGGGSDAAALYNANAQTYAPNVRGCVYASDMQKMIDEITLLRNTLNNIIQQLVG